MRCPIRSGALYDTHHGLTNAVFMPYVLVFNRTAIETKVERLAAYLGLKPRFDAFLDWMLTLREELGVPHTLAGLKVGDEKFDLMSAMAPEDPDRRRQSGADHQGERPQALRGCARRPALTAA